MYRNQYLATLGAVILIGGSSVIGALPAVADETVSTATTVVEATETIAPGTAPEAAPEPAPEVTTEVTSVETEATLPQPEPAAEPVAEAPPAQPTPAQPTPAQEPAQPNTPSTQRSSLDGAVATSASASFAAKPEDDGATKKIAFCHATASETNPFNFIETSVNAFFQAGHDTHQNFEDIVPPFSYVKQGDTIDFPGLNWDAEGQAIFNAGCSTPDDQPLLATASVSFTAATCSSPQLLVLGAITNASWGTVTDPEGDLDYRVVATADDGAEFAGGAGELVFEGQLDPIDSGLSCDTTEVKKIEFCHATGSEQNPYVLLETSVNAFFQAGHDTHQNFEDIVPPFSYVKQGQVINFPGLNWDAEGQAFFEQGCGTEVTPKIATAEVSITPATCESGEMLVLGPVVNATWGEVSGPVGPSNYSVTATATGDATFEGGLSQLTFQGELDGPLDPTAPPCDLPVQSLVLPTVSFTQFTCTSQGSITLGVAEGYNPDFVRFTVNGASGLTVGTYPAAPGLATVTAQAVEPHQLEPEWVNPPAFAFVAPTATECSTPVAPTKPSSTVLAHTGGSATGPALGIGLAVLLAGAGAVYLSRRRAARH
ncbi:LPXTG cell wall anchor domain-containing protein [Antiquaquibacter oligotrophicus]|nr:LPXTG cell wall anchor domain-containing protein [Antiquaquibacter oligotrophicus]UDF14135.1 LPXTG cell wall anchor domain-containing protein [Antiquaquibacter oligotrophicus]